MVKEDSFPFHLNDYIKGVCCDIPDFCLFGDILGFCRNLKYLTSVNLTKKTLRLLQEVPDLDFYGMEMYMKGGKIDIE